MDADQPLKMLFRTRPRDLLALTGDAGAGVLSAQVLELSAVKRSVDLVLFLRRGGQRYVRHVEFQVRHRADVAFRCFEYATRLVAHLRVIGMASRQIRRLAPEAQQPDLLAILQSLSEGRYTARQLARVIPEEVVMASSLFDKAIEKGRLDEARHVCAEFVKRHHPAVAAQVQPAIAACSDVTRLHRWTLRVPEVSAADLVRLVTRSEARRSSRRRAPRPSRRSRSTAAR